MVLSSLTPQRILHIVKEKLFFSMPKTATLQEGIVTIASGNLYTLSVDRRAHKTLILMQLLIAQVNTKDFPMTRQFLSIYLPSIFRSTCYNEDNLPFDQEVAQTEVGHLFEHILLEYLCILQLENGMDEAVYEGVTNWDWLTEPQGSFHITIKAEADELDIFQKALERSVTLMNIILTGDETVQAELPIPAHTTRH